MKKFLLAGAAVVFAGVATMAVAADHKGKPADKPAHAAVAAPAKTTGHKDASHKRHHVVKKHHVAHKSHTK
jgi:hypothetical protein